MHTRLCSLWEDFSSRTCISELSKTRAIFPKSNSFLNLLIKLKFAFIIIVFCTQSKLNEIVMFGKYFHENKTFDVFLFV